MCMRLQGAGGRTVAGVRSGQGVHKAVASVCRGGAELWDLYRF